MDKIDAFKKFAKEHSELQKVVSSGKETWQSLYELYDIYGPEDSIWKKYNTSMDLNSLKELVGKLDTKAIQGHIQTAQKALSLIEELTTLKTDAPVVEAVSKPETITQFFGD